MTPILGITASSITPFTLGDYQSIATVSVTTATQANVEFTSIPSTYQHLQIRMLVRNSSTSNGYTAQLNGDTGSNYARHYLIGNGSSASAAAFTSQTSMILSDASISTTGADIFGAAICDILDYTNTNKNTTIRTLGGFDSNGGGAIFFNSGLWLNTAAVTSIKIIPDAGGFVQNSSFALYGIK